MDTWYSILSWWIKPWTKVSPLSRIAPMILMLSEYLFQSRFSSCSMCVQDDDGTHPHWEFLKMIREFTDQLDYNPITTSDKVYFPNQIKNAIGTCCKIYAYFNFGILIHVI